ncbi:hypothetical protein M430DRAFT_207074 [Amorphotheca resinae ATCC 22711]|uniref:Uncharacterized protein n=1 Tax=Amorphotheca resinae ATCC 22711 TaxID=857342 RepID=A0A2T3BC24_AMORE|nr:hypothetical protein M430DRAFT_207074 [Amorphotheca resinae ATCC 22711]PSS25819.1 hypothetical protein M430DRAFT_207074 [Amorphotheca resinae ATCC 22711]
MLSSQVVSASQAPISPLLLQPSSTAVLRSRAGSRPQRQIRFRLWSSYQNSGYQKEFHRRSRSMKHKYTDALNRKPSYDCQSPTLARQFALKGFMYNTWRGQDPRATSRWVDIDELNNSKNEKQKRQDEGFEDVETSAFDTLLNSKDGLYDLFQARSRLFRGGSGCYRFVPDQDWKASTPISSNDIQNDKPSPQRTDNQKDLRDFQSQHSASPEPEYEIDPITNRKVFTNKSSEHDQNTFEVPVKTFKGYRSQFQEFKPPTPADSQSEVKSPEQVLPNQKQDSASVKPNSIDESLKEYETDESYKPYFAYEPDGKKPDPVREGLKDYETKESYKPYFAYEPDGKIPDPVREGLKEYETNESYKPYFAYEPDGKRPDPVQEGLRDYDSRVSYESFPWGVPDKEVSQDSVRSDPVQEGLRDYDSKTYYGPVMYNEPDGKSLQEHASIQESSKLPRIEDARLNQRISSPYKVLRRQDDADTREDLDLLRPSDVRAASGIIKGSKKETEAEKIAKRKELEADFQKHAVEDSELQSIASQIKGRVNSKPAEVSSDLPATERKMTGNFVRDFPEEFEKKWTAENNHSGILTPKPQTDAWGYDKTPKGLELSYEQEVQKSEQEFINGLAPTERYARRPDIPRIQTSLDRSGTQEEDGKRESKATAMDSINPIEEAQKLRAKYANIKLQNELDPYSKEPQGLETNYEEELKLKNEADPYSKKPQGLETSYEEERKREQKLAIEADPYSKKPQGLETSYDEERKLEQKLAIEADPYSKEPQGLETSYAEEQKLEIEADPYSKKPQGLETSYAEECAAKQGEGDLSVFVSSYGSPKRDEDSSKKRDTVSENESRRLDNQKKNVLKQKDRDLVRQIRSVYEEKYGTIDHKHRQVPEEPKTSQYLDGESAQVVESTSEAPEPTLYKILAYDPTMQSISTAETTSIVPDTASALTPAEVLLRLSNPSKFFPHFEPLQAQGYEIVSGSGDVLVFRKVRSAGPAEVKEEPSPSSRDRMKKATNPIDGTQSGPIATTGNFASPTGFVNHDPPYGSNPAFKSNVDVRREEDVFSGKSNWSRGTERPQQRKKMSLAKRMLLGAVWVGGLSYTLGVVSEYFKTGGIDGLGPQGF